MPPDPSDFHRVNGAARSRPSDPAARLRPAPVVIVVGRPSPEAEAVVRRLLRAGDRAIAWVVPADGRRDAARLADAPGGARLTVHEGSAAEPGLGLPHTAWRLLDTADEIYCVAPRADVETGHVQDFADECPRLRRLHVVPLAAASSGPSGSQVWAWVRPSAVVRRAVATAGLPFRALSAALRVGASGASLAGAVVSGVRAWTQVVDVDLDAALSWEDLERDLWPGHPRTA
ncbi:MAG: hypothetical protein AAGI91_12785 [Bacteroidota bacterium]